MNESKMNSDLESEVQVEESNDVDHTQNENQKQEGDNCVECRDISSEAQSQKLLRSGPLPSKKCNLHSLTNKYAEDKGEDVKCKFCEKEFVRKDLLVQHEKSHKNDHLKCKICNVQFSGKNTLDSHIRIHTGEKPFKCDLCEKSFNRPDTLKNHLRNHTNERPYECIKCDKKFKFNSSLHSHKCVPESELKARPFKCITCNKTYINKCSLKIHMQLHNKKNSLETEMYKCFICEKEFAYTFTLKKHLLRLHSTENSHQCKFLGCPKTFKEKYQLILHHKRDHSKAEPKIGKKIRIPIPAKCKYCGKDFSRWISNLRRHERTHTKEKILIYKCNFCCRRFKDYRIFRNHAKFHQEKNKKINAGNVEKILKNQPIVRLKKLSIDEVVFQNRNRMSTENAYDSVLQVTDATIKREIEDDLDAILCEIEQQNIKSIKIEIDEALNEIFGDAAQSNQKLNDGKTDSNNNYKRKLRCNAKKDIKSEPLKTNNQKNVDDSAFSVVFNWPRSKRNE